MLSENHEQLISDTLNYRAPSGSTSFVANDPGLKLVNGDANFLEPIRAALKETAQMQNHQHLNGLGYVIGAFLVISCKYSSDSIVPFIVTLPEKFQVEIIRNIPAFFRKDERSGGYNFAVAPSTELVAYVRQAASGQNAELQRAAERTLKFI